ncbi:hypothetical protein F5888DRAFT_1605037 [Russula emetica]|nr:hypothetical protein F5888DRAFT_1605037 [Russula emetica]
MPTNNHTGESYQVTSSGTNSQGNDYDHRVSESGGHGYHYSNNDGSYYYQNTDGSKYYNSGDGYASYTPSEGQASQQTSKK